MGRMDTDDPSRSSLFVTLRGVEFQESRSCSQVHDRVELEDGRCEKPKVAKVNILQVVPHYVPATRFGGPQRVAHSLGRALVNLGHHVTVCTTNLKDEGTDLDVPLDEEVDVDGIRVFYCRTVGSRFWGFSPELVKAIKREVSRADLVLVHAHYQFANWIGARLSRKAGVPYVIFPHGSLHRSGMSHRNAWVKLIYLSLLERRNLSRAMFLAFNAAEELRWSRYGDRGVVIPNGIDPDELSQPGNEEDLVDNYPVLRDKVIYLFLGRVDVKHKGLDLLLPAFRRLASESPNAHLVIAGPDEQGGVSRLRKIIDGLKIADRVTFTGLLVGNERLQALRAADVFLLPSRFEGMSVALLEALFLGLPVLVTEQVGMADEIRRLSAGEVVPATTEAIYQGLDSLSRPTARDRFRGVAVEYVRESYTWPAIADALLQKVSDRWQDNRNVR